jgi:hypothetical protein
MIKPIIEYILKAYSFAIVLMLITWEKSIPKINPKTIEITDFKVVGLKFIIYLGLIPI